MISRASNNIFSIWWWTVDKYYIAAVSLLLILGCILSAAASPAVALRIGYLDSFVFVKQHIVFAGTSMLILLLVSMLKPEQFKKLYIFIALVSLFALVLVLFFGYETKGSIRWLRIMGLSIQPSEFLKPGFIIATAWLLTTDFKDKNRIAYYGYFIFYLIILLLLLKEPDVGQSCLITILWGSMLFLSGLSIYIIILLSGGFCFLSYLIYQYSHHVYERVQKFINGIGDTFQIDMGREAILHGGWFGVGAGEGTIKRVIPDSHTDFVFSVAAEEYGIIFCILLVILFAFLVLYPMIKIRKEENKFIWLSTIGLALQIAIQSFINIGVNLHMMPAKGMTLPFISYGGSSMLAISLTFGGILCLIRNN